MIAKETAETLKTKYPRSTKLHMLPKSYKIDNLERPFVSFIGCHSSNIWKYIDYDIEPIVQNIHSYVQDFNYGGKIVVYKHMIQKELPQSKQPMKVI